MKRMTSAILAVALGLTLGGRSFAGPTEALEQAQKLLNLNDGRAAVRVLEEALSEPGAERSRIVLLLKRAYESAAAQAETAGRKSEAAVFREDLAILSRLKSTPKVVAESPTSRSIDPPAALTVEAPPAAPSATIQSIPNSPIDPLPSLSSRVQVAPEPQVAQPATKPAFSLEEADVAYRDKKYTEAGRIYSGLASTQQLPEGRKEQWAYCRWFAVVQRINAKPSSPTEWDSIDTELEEIRKLCPLNFFGEYLKQRAATRIPGSGKSALKQVASKNEPVIIRGQTPESPPSANPTSPPAPIAKPAPVPLTQNRGSRTGMDQVIETTNFRIHHSDEGLAEQVARVAEDTREEQVRKWSGASSSSPWVPRCEIFLYPTAQVYSQETRQPLDSPGFSTMGVTDGRIHDRKIHLRVGARGLVPAVLPHEVTHVVLADLFTTQQIPRWADEGMAVLSEPTSEQTLRANDLDEPLKSGRLFTVTDLMVMDYPDGEFWSVYYAQSVSLTKFLVERGTPGKFVQFLQASQRNGTEVELQRVYGFKNPRDLQDQWLTWARRGPNLMTANGSSVTRETK